MKIDDRGAEVGKLQKALLKRGYTLPRWGVDKHLGSETWVALFNYAEDYDLAWDEAAFESESGPVPQPVIDHLLAGPSTAHSAVKADGSPKKDSTFFDITGDHPLLKGKKTPRNPETVHTIVLHQTAVKFGTRKKDRERVGERRALHLRFDNVACHLAALTNGDVLYVNRLPRYVYHAHVANRFSVGIEVEGLYEGIEGKKSTIWGNKKATPFTDTTIDAARRAVRFAFEEGVRLGMPLTWIMPHRAYHRSRRSDPGEQIWKAVVPWAVEEFGLRVNYELARNGGRPVPVEWDPNAAYDYRGRKL